MVNVLFLLKQHRQTNLIEFRHRQQICLFFLPFHVCACVCLSEFLKLFYHRVVCISLFIRFFFRATFFI